MSSKAPSANWLSLKRTLASTSEDRGARPHKRRKTTEFSHGQVTQNRRSLSSKSTSSPHKTILQPPPLQSSKAGEPDAHKPVGDADSKENLTAMILRPTAGAPMGRPTKFLALDCEMVGVGPFGLESALARVTVVNYVGDVVLDEFVLPQETVTDWRTAVSGVRKEDMANAKSFTEVQKLVADLLEDRFLVGHALKNDLSALMLSHPWLRTRDTQGFQTFRVISRSKYPALRKLVKAVFGINIQEGEHNSVIDARAPMALYRLYRKEWEGRGAVKEPIEVSLPASKSPSDFVNKSSGATVKPVAHKSDSSGSPSRKSWEVKGASSPRSQELIISVEKKRKEGNQPKINDANQTKKQTKNVLEAKKKQSLGVHKKKTTGISSGLSVIVTQKKKPSSKTKPTAKPTKIHKNVTQTDERKPNDDSGKPSVGWYCILGS